MATSTVRSPRRDPQTGRQPIEREDEIPLGMAEPLGTVERPLGSMQRPVDPIDERRDDVNIRNPVPEARRVDRGFTGTFAIAAIVLLVAFLVALYLGMSGNDVATTTPADQAPVTETQPETTGQAPAPDAAEPATPPAGETTGEAPAPAPAPDTGTGTTGNTNQ
jgi:hypothetical protein